jgi:sporulation protein YlmC with PRC-barrel domain
MSRQALTTIVLSSLIAGSALAQPAPGPGQPARSNEFVQTDDQVLVKNLRQKPVYASDRAGLGEIEDVVVNQMGAVKAVLIDIGRGSTQRLVAVPMSALELRKLPGAQSESGSFEVFLKMSREEFDRAPIFRTPERKL